MEQQQVQVALGENISSVTGAVNGIESIFVLNAFNFWETQAARSVDGKYVLNIVATTDLGIQYRYVITRYYFYGWTPPVYDRAQQDVDEKRVKGFLNYHDLNRIESNCQYLVDYLATHGYSIDIETKINWTSLDIPYLEELDRVLQNVGIVSDAFYKLTTTPDLPSSMDSLVYTTINDIEHILFDTKYLIDQMVIGLRHAGTFYAGSDNTVLNYS